MSDSDSQPDVHENVSDDVAASDDLTEVTETSVSEFERQAEEAPSGLIEEFVDFLLHSKRWWLLPIIVVLLLMSALIWISGTSLGSFLYRLY
jgi:hypothetical protein